MGNISVNSDNSISSGQAPVLAIHRRLIYGETEVPVRIEVDLTEVDAEYHDFLIRMAEALYNDKEIK